MQTLDELVRSRRSERSNNFLLIRLLAATLVVYGHSFALSPVRCASCRDIVKAWTSYVPSQTLGVNIFFIISGFLVVGSYANRDNLTSYLKSRALRLFPGLVVCAAVMVLVVGPIATSLPLGEYFRSPELLRYFAINSSLYSTVYELPGIRFSDTPYGTALNGSLWTIPVEGRLYLLVALAGGFGLLRSRIVANIAVLGLILAALYLPSALPLIPLYPGPYRVAAFFALGAWIYLNRASIPVDFRILALLLATAALSHELPSFETLCGASLAYAIFCLAYAPKLSLPRWIEDYSYGIYLYSFPIQQLIAYTFPTIEPYGMMAISIPLSWVAGALSWHLVEKRALALKEKPRDQAIAGTGIA